MSHVQNLYCHQKDPVIQEAPISYVVDDAMGNVQVSKRNLKVKCVQISENDRKVLSKGTRMPNR